MLNRIFVLIIGSWVSLGLTAGDLQIKIRFDLIQDLKTDDHVVFEKNSIGKVIDISYSKKGYYLTEIKIKKDFVPVVTENSRFFIITDPNEKNKNAIEMIHTRQGGACLENGAIVDGTDKMSAFFEQMQNGLDKGFENLKKQLKTLSDGLRAIPDSKEFKKLENELNRLLDELKKSSSAAREKMKKDVLPQLKKRLDALKERLKKLGREQEVKPLETQLNKISET